MAYPRDGHFRISASALKLFDLCPRSWWLKFVAHAPDDQGAGGLYIKRGNDFDVLVQRLVRDGVRGDPLAPKLANRQLAEAARHLPPPGGAEVQFVYDVDAGDFRVNGKPDLRRVGTEAVHLGDTKTTSDRGPGRGAAEDRPAYALTDENTLGGNLRPLSNDVQFRLYAWCEFTLDPAVAFVHGEWVYASKADCPKCWVSRATELRAESTRWFDSYVRPTVAAMRAYAASAALTAEDIPANPDSCRRCFVQRACPGPYEGRNVYGIGDE